VGFAVQHDALFIVVADSKHFHHRAIGNLALAYESVDMVSEPGLSLTVYAAEPAFSTAQARALLASWAANPVEPATSPLLP
jgi:MmyB-like transcription regulator ligand binding domain